MTVCVKKNINVFLSHQIQSVQYIFHMVQVYLVSYLVQCTCIYNVPIDYLKF